MINAFVDFLFTLNHEWYKIQNLVLVFDRQHPEVKTLQGNLSLGTEIISNWILKKLERICLGSIKCSEIFQ
jgi:hypothetical protein